MNGLPRAPRDELPTSPGELWALCVRYPLIVLGMLELGVVFALVWLGRQEPVWNASTTLLLRRDDGTAASVVAPLRAMAQRPETSSEIALIESHRPAEETVRPGPGELGSDGDEPPRRLGLTTLVEDTTYRPLASLGHQLFGWERAEGRLYARARLLEPNAPREVLVEFPRERHVRVSIPENKILGIVQPGPRGLEAPWLSGEAVEYRGLHLRLVVDGDVGTKKFIVRVQEEREAVRSVLEQVSATEVEPESGLVRVTARDGDPHRAADLANAVVANYLALHEDQTRARTRARLEQIEGELTRIREDLHSSYGELVQLQRDRPLSVDSAESARSLTLNLTGRSADYTAAQLELTLVEDALDALEHGDAAGLSKIADSTADPLTRTLIGQLADLLAEAQVQERSDAGPYRSLLQSRWLEMRTARDALTAQLEGLELALRATEQDGVRGAGMVTDGEDAATSLLAESIVRMTLQRDELLAADYLAEHPQVVQLDNAISSALDELRTMLRGRIDRARSQRSNLDATLGVAEGEIRAHPEREREKIEAALGRFQDQILDSLTNLRGALSRRVDSLAHELATLEEQLAALPDGERRLVEPLQRVNNAKERVAELLEARDTVKMMAAFVQTPAEWVDPAVAPARRASPRPAFALLLAALFGLAIGLTLAFLFDRVAGRVESERELEETLGLMVLGSLPRLALGGAGRCLKRVFGAFRDDLDGELVHGFRALRTNLDVLLAGRGGARLVGITSSQAREGKSVGALGLALAFARANQRVLLVRCDGDHGEAVTRRGGLVQVLEGPTPGGSEQGAVNGAVTPRSSGMPGLDVLPPGGSGAAVADTCARSDARARLEALSRPYDLVLFDLPPIERPSEVLPLARLMDGLVLVVRSRHARRSAVRRALTHLDRLGAPVYGTLLNAATRTGARRREGWVSRLRPSRVAAARNTAGERGDGPRRVA